MYVCHLIATLATLISDHHYSMIMMNRTLASLVARWLLLVPLSRWLNRMPKFHIDSKLENYAFLFQVVCGWQNFLCFRNSLPSSQLSLQFLCTYEKYPLSTSTLPAVLDQSTNGHNMH